MRRSRKHPILKEFLDNRYIVTVTNEQLKSHVTMLGIIFTLHLTVP